MIDTRDIGYEDLTEEVVSAVIEQMGLHDLLADDIGCLLDFLHREWRNDLEDQLKCLIWSYIEKLPRYVFKEYSERAKQEDRPFFTFIYDIAGFDVPFTIQAANKRIAKLLVKRGLGVVTDKVIDLDNYEQLYQRGKNDIFVTINWSYLNILMVLQEKGTKVTKSQLEDIADYMRIQLRDQSIREGWGVIHQLLPDAMKDVLGGDFTD